MLNRDWGLLGKYHNNLIYGGGIVFSILVVIVVVLASLVEFSQLIDEKRSDFNSRKTQILVEIETRQQAMLRSIVAAETLWGRQQSPGSRPRPEREAGVSGQVMPWIFASGDVENDRYIDILDELAYFANSSFLPQGRALSAYVFSPDRKFVAALRPVDFPMDESAGVLDRIGIQIAKIQQDPERMQRVQEPLQPIWLAPKNSLLTGQRSFQIAASAFQSGKPFLIIVKELPVHHLNRFLDQGDEEGEFYLLNEDGRVILGTGADNGSDPERFSFLEAWDEEGVNNYFMRNYGCFYWDGSFHFLSSLPKADLSVLHVFSWKDVFESLKERILPYWLAAFFWIVLLWTFFLYFNSKVFSPIYKQSKAVFDSENLSRTIIAMAPYGLGIFALNEKKILWENDLMSRYRDSIVSNESGGEKTLTDLFYDIYREIYRGNRISIPERISEEVIVKFGGEVAELSVTLSNGSYQGNMVILCGFSDITIHKQIEKNLKEARESAENANQAKSAFLAAMSHDIRTPLNAILGNLEILGRSRLSDSQHARLKTIFSASHSLLALLSDVLDFSKIESGEMQVENKDFNLRNAVQQVANIYRPLALDSGIDFFLKVDCAIPEIYCGDPVRVKQILNNLLSNAVKFTEKGSIGVEVRESAGKLIMEVTDTGIGIHASQQPLIFDAFKQANSDIPWRFGGTGLGLALCKRMAHLMKGDISFSSSIHQGSVFRLILPMQFSPSMESLPSEENDLGEGLVDMVREVSILVVDDHPANRMLLLDQLGILGCIVDSADNGQAALRYMENHDYDLVFTDLQMRGMDGYALASLIGLREKKVPVIAITSHTSEEDKRKCREHGVIDVLFKPASLQDISGAIIRNLHLEGGSRAHVSLQNTNQNQQLKNVLMSSAYQSIDQMREAGSESEMSFLLGEIHSMKGSFAVANHPDMVKQLTRLEDVLLSKDMQAFAECLMDLEKRLAEL